MRLKQTVGTGVLAIFIATQVFFGAAFLLKPQPVKAIPTFNTEIWNWYDIGKEILKGITLRIATNYAQQYLDRFVSQLSDKYKIKNFLYYDRVLSDFYLSRLISDKIENPQLKQVFSLLEATYVTGTASGVSDAARKEALIPQLKRAVTNYYQEKTGTDPNKIYSPRSFSSDVEYFDYFMAYSINPPGFVEQNLQAQFGEFQSSATTAAQLEILVGNGLKAGRFIGGTCQITPPQDGLNTPAACTAAGGAWQEALLDKARGFIDSPSTYVENQLSTLLDTRLKTQFKDGNPFATIGMLLGDFIFNQLNLNNNGDGPGVLYDGGDAYDSSGYSDFSDLEEYDLDDDGFPEGYDIDGDGLVDICYHGVVTQTGEASANAPVQCKHSSVVGSSPYFNSICLTSERAIKELTDYLKFITTYGPQHIKNGTEFKDENDAGIWGRRTVLASTAVNNLLNSIKALNNSGFDNYEVTVSRYASYISRMSQSINGDGTDLDLKRGLGNGGGGISALTEDTAEILQYIKDIYEVALEGRCDNPDGDAAASVPPPVITPPPGSGPPHACADPGNSVANHGGALDSAIAAVIAANPNGIADKFNTEADATVFIDLVAAELRNRGYQATRTVLNGNGNVGAPDKIGVWQSSDNVIERYDMISGVGDNNKPLRQAAQSLFTGDIPLTCVSQ